MTRLSGMTTADRLHYALALLSDLEFTDALRHSETCPICGWPVGGHHGTRHEPGCSLEAVLLGHTPHRLVDLERCYGDAALGADLQNRRRYRTTVVDDFDGIIDKEQQHGD